MRTENSKRLQRLIDIRTRAANVEEAKVARALLRVREEDARHLEALQRWETEADRPTDHLTCGDLATDRRHLSSLRVNADKQKLVVDEAMRDEGIARHALLQARQALRTLEAWREGIQETANAEIARKDRMATDELAARRGAGRHQ